MTRFILSIEFLVALFAIGFCFLFASPVFAADNEFFVSIQQMDSGECTSNGYGTNCDEVLSPGPFDFAVHNSYEFLRDDQVVYQHNYASGGTVNAVAFENGLALWAYFGNSAGNVPLADGSYTARIYSGQNYTGDSMFFSFVRSAGVNLVAQGPVLSANTRIITPLDYPAPSQNVSSPVTFSFKFYKGLQDDSGLNSVCVEYRRFTNPTLGQTLPTPECIPISASSSIQTAEIGPIDIPDNEVLGWRACFEQSSIFGSSLVECSPWQNFSEGVVPDLWGDLYNTATSSTTTLAEMTGQCDRALPFYENSICNAMVWLFVPSGVMLEPYTTAMESILPSKFPFSYFYDISRVIQRATRQGDTGQFMSFTLDLSDTVFASEIPILSTSTVSSIMGNTMVNWIRVGIAYALYLGFALFAFFKIKMAFAKSSSS